MAAKDGSSGWYSPQDTNSSVYYMWLNCHGTKPTITELEIKQSTQGPPHFMDQDGVKQLKHLGLGSRSRSRLGLGANPQRKVSHFTFSFAMLSAIQ